MEGQEGKVEWGKVPEGGQCLGNYLYPQALVATEAVLPHQVSSVTV